MNDGVWSQASEWPVLGDADVHVWLAHLPAAQSHAGELSAVLSPDERERAGRFRFEEHRVRWQLARGLLRVLLGRYAGIEAAALRFTQTEHGKPSAVGTGIHFNNSHSGDYAAFAFTRAAAVGVDIEQVRDEMQRRDEIARKYFAPGEQLQLNELPEAVRCRAFFDIWARKEAFVKARGDGLFSGLDQFETQIEKPHLVAIQGAPPVNWWMSALPEVDGYAGAVAVNAQSCRPSFWKWAGSVSQ
jgi:4'-phosphopantetheinyl transferase